MEQKRIYFSAGIAVIVVLSIYVWFIAIGPWHERGYTSNYYYQMASAFQHGQLALETKPDPALLALPNLYDPKARKNIPLLGDASVYKGNYYLYFGPLPSLPLALVRFICPIQPGDQAFVYIFLIGLLFVQSLFFIVIFENYFANLPYWIIPFGVLLLGLSGPFTRMLAHPYIHEAAISGGQFFATAGLFLAYLALRDHPADSRKLLWAGVLWSCSIATRITQLVPIGAVVLVTWLFILIENRKSRSGWKFINPSIALMVPVLLTGVLLAWYNWARFESIFEFGLYYQLAAFNLQANYSALFSRVYIVQNIYNYFFNPFALHSKFPFAFPLPGSEKSILPSHELPRLYAVEGKFPGLLNSTPVLIFAFIPLLVLMVRLWRASQNREIKSTSYNHFDWTVISLLAAFVAGAIPSLLIFYVGFRYETEFITGFLMLGLIGVCQTFAIFKNANTQKLIALVSASLMIFSILVNVALAFSGVTG